jgi:hypothetical protein
MTDIFSPKIIFVDFTEHETEQHLGSAFFSTTKFRYGVEYHLAPVWHDAVKDPPKEDGKYIGLFSDVSIVRWSEKEVNKATEYYPKGWSYYSEKLDEWVSCEPKKWMHLPLPPERSGE